jgi:hypothetical protein
MPNFIEIGQWIRQVWREMYMRPSFKCDSLRRFRWNSRLWDLRFSQQCCWGFRYCGIWCDNDTPKRWKPLAHWYNIRLLWYDGLQSWCNEKCVAALISQHPCRMCHVPWLCQCSVANCSLSQAAPEVDYINVMCLLGWLQHTCNSVLFFPFGFHILVHRLGRYRNFPISDMLYTYCNTDV